MRYPHFARALRALFKNHRGVMTALDVPRRTAFTYLSGARIPHGDRITKIYDYPELVAAIKRDSDERAARASDEPTQADEPTVTPDEPALLAA